MSQKTDAPAFTPEDYRRAAAIIGLSSSLEMLEIIAMLDAAAEMAQPKTCVTCIAAESCAILWEARHQHKCDVDSFGCTLWTPRETPHP